jgi:hypothetical protein
VALSILLLLVFVFDSIFTTRMASINELGELSMIGYLAFIAAGE